MKLKIQVSYRLFSRPCQSLVVDTDLHTCLERLKGEGVTDEPEILHSWVVSNSDPSGVFSVGGSCPKIEKEKEVFYLADSRSDSRIIPGQYK